MYSGYGPKQAESLEYTAWVVVVVRSRILYRRTSEQSTRSVAELRKPFLSEWSCTWLGH